MSKLYTQVSTAHMTRGEWLELRRTGIGGSDAPALILPKSEFKWARPSDVFAAKVHGNDRPAGLAAAVGTYLEPFVAERFTAETGIQVRRYPYMLRSKQHPFMLADIDRKIQGRDEGLECKTTSAFLRSKFTDELFPLNYYVQIQHYLAVTGWTRWHLGVLIGNMEFRRYVVERNEEDIAQIIDRERSFWKMVEKRDENALRASDAWQ